MKTPKITISDTAPGKGRPLPKGEHIINPAEITERAVKGMIYADKFNMETTKKGTPRYILKETAGKATVIPIAPKGEEIDDIAAYNASLLLGLDDLTADVFKIIHAYGRDHKDEKGYFWVYAADILDERGKVPKTKKVLGKIYNVGHRPDDIDDIWLRIQQLRGLKLIIGTAIINGRKLRKPLVHKGYLLVVTEELTYRGTDRAYAWKCKFYDGMEDLVRNERFCNQFRKALSYDHIRRSPEKRICDYAYDGFRLNGNKAFGRRVSTIIEALNLPCDEKRPQMSIDRIEAALNRLIEDGALKNWGYRISKGEYTKKLKLPSRNVWAEYQLLTLCFFPPKTLPAIVKPRQKALRK
jgi:hypothetical protein